MWWSKENGWLYFLYSSFNDTASSLEYIHGNIQKSQRLSQYWSICSSFLLVTAVPFKVVYLLSLLNWLYVLTQHTALSSTVPQFQQHTENTSLVAVISSHKQEEIKRGQSKQASKDGWDTATFLAATVFSSSVSKPRHKVCRNLRHVHILPYNSLACSLQEI
jgi:hypothetical protein